MCWERIRALVLARQPLEPRIPRDAQRHFVLGAQFFKLSHDAIAGQENQRGGEWGVESDWWAHGQGVPDLMYMVHLAYKQSMAACMTSNLFWMLAQS